jgi:hypothetical protein
MAKLKSGTRIYGTSTIDSTLTVGSSSSTGTSSQSLQVTGGAYVSGNTGIGTTNPTSKLHIVGDTYITGILTANRIISGLYGEFTGGSISGTNIVGTSLSISGISTLNGSVGIGTTNPTSKLWVDGDGYFTGILTANRIFSSIYGEFTGGSISGTNIVGTSLSISGISTLNGSVGIGTTNSEAKLTVFDTNGAVIRLTGGTGLNNSIVFREGGSTGQDYFRIYHEGSAGASPNNLFKIQCADGSDGIIDVTAITITQTGLVGIKGNANSSYEFTVNGSALVTGTINATSYRDSSSNILVSSNSLGSGVVNSSLTSVGTLGQLNVSGNSSFTGISTFAGITTVTGVSLFTKQLSVSGVSTFAGITTVTGVSLFTKQLSVSGVSTFAGITTVTGTTLFAKQVNVSGVITASNFVGSGSGLTGIVGVGTGVYLQSNNVNVGAARTINFGSDLSVNLSPSGIATVNTTNSRSIIMSLIF